MTRRTKNARVLKQSIDAYLSAQLLKDGGSVAEIFFFVEADNAVVAAVRTKDTDAILWVINACGPLDMCRSTEPSEVDIQCCHCPSQLLPALRSMSANAELNDRCCPECSWPLREGRAISVRDDVGPAQVSTDVCDACGWRDTGPMWTLIDE